MLVERLRYNKCTRLEENPSSLGLKTDVRRVVFFCPRCVMEGYPVEAEMKYECPHCHLWYMRLGAYLYCAEEEEGLSEWNLDAQYPEDLR